MKVKKLVTPKPAEDKNSTDNNDLIVKRIGGGSIIEHRPLFSRDGE